MRSSFLWPYIERLSLRILAIRNDDGGYPATKEGDTSCPWTTASLPSVALQSLGPRPQDQKSHRATVRWLRENDKLDGRFSFVLGNPPCIDTTAAIFEFLSRVHLGYGLTDEDKKFAMKVGRHLLAAQHGGWGFLFDWTDPLPYSTYWTVRALDVGRLAFPDLKPDIDLAMHTAADWLWATKQKKGWSGQSRKPSAVYTAAALLSLRLCNKIETPTYDELITLVHDPSDSEPLWGDGIERHAGFTFVRFAMPWCTLSLSYSSPEAGQAAIIDACIARLLDSINEDRVFFKDTELNTWPSRDVTICLLSLAMSTKSITLSELLRAPLFASDAKVTTPMLMMTSATTLVRRGVKDLRRKFRILHLSDLHFGAYQMRRRRPLESTLVIADLHRINKGAVDAIVISGDLTTNIGTGGSQPNHSLEFEYALSFIRDLAEGLSVPINRVIAVPGNHDVDWNESGTPVGGVRAPDLAYNGFYERLYGEKAQEYLRCSVFDAEANIAIVGLNSCLRCVDSRFAWAGYVGEAQFRASLDDLTKAGCGASATKLAVLHHHLVPVTYREDIPAEAKHVSITLDAEGLLAKLLANGFDMVLHGHQHQPFCGIESRIYRGDLTTYEGRLTGNEKTIIIGAGSIGAPADELGLVARNLYNIIELDKNGMKLCIRESNPEVPDTFEYFSIYSFSFEPTRKR